MEQDFFCFEIDSLYKSGRKRTDTIVSTNELSMWKTFEKHHDMNKIVFSAIVDCWYC